MVTTTTQDSPRLLHNSPVDTTLPPMRIARPALATGQLLSLTKARRLS